METPTRTAQDLHALAAGHLAAVFRGMCPRGLAEITRNVVPRDLPEGQVLIHEGSKPDHVFILLSGRLGVFARDSDGRLSPIRVVDQAGSLLGEQSAREGRHFANATVIALSGCSIAPIPTSLFRTLLEADPGAAAGLADTGKRQAIEKLKALSAEMAAASGFSPANAPTPLQFPAGTSIHSAGQPACSAFFVLSGRIDLFPPGCPVPHESLGPGMLVGAQDVITGSPRKFNAVASTPVELLEVPAPVLLVGHPSEPSLGTSLKSLEFVHSLPHLGAAYRFVGEAEGRNCIVTDYLQSRGRRVRVRFFPGEQRIEASTFEASGETEVVSTPIEGLSLLMGKTGRRIVGLTANHSWPHLPEAMATLLRGSSLEQWQVDALRATGRWMEESAATRAQGMSTIACSCTNASIARLRQEARQVDTLEELIRITGAGTVCGGCRSRLPVLIGKGSSILCSLQTEYLCEGSIRARLQPVSSETLPIARPGQHVTVEGFIDQRWIGRPYTLTHFGPDYYELGVKLEEGGLFSNWMRNAPPGILVRLGEPSGDVCPASDDPRPLVYIVAGIGVTTAIAAVRGLAGKRDLRIHYVHRNPQEAPYLEELRTLSDRGLIRLDEIATRISGRPSSQHWRDTLAGGGRCEVVICGPDAFNQSVLKACSDLGGVEAVAESFLHPDRGQGSMPRPGSWRIPGFTPRCPVGGDLVTTKSRLPMDEEASRFLRQYHEEMKPGADPSPRIGQVLEEIRSSGTWTQTSEELGFAARIAWRNSGRCIGRLYWRGLHLRDCRDLERPEEIAAALFDHLRFAFNGGNLRPAISVFPAGTPGRPGPRIWNPLLLRYAGLQLRSGKQVGDPAQNDLTRRIMELGWEPDGTDFDLLPLVIEVPGEEPALFELPEDCRHETWIRHPHHPWLEGLGLRWNCIPAVSDMMLDAGGIQYRLAPFNGWYLNTEIAARNLTDTNRYNLLPVVAEAMGLDISDDRTLWRDKALILLNEAVLHSFDRDGVKMADHHSAGHEFLEFCREEQKAGREPYGKWMWLVPPVSSSTSVLYQEPFVDVAIKPAFRNQDPVWKGRPLSGRRTRPMDHDG